MTLRELAAAAKIRQEEQWDHTADQMALIASVQSGKPFERADFHPYMTRPERTESIDPRAEHERIKRRERRRKGRE